MRYVTIPNAEWVWQQAKAADYIPRTVHELEPEKPVATGLLDASGHKIYRMPTDKRFGFVPVKGAS